MLISHSGSGPAGGDLAGNYPNPTVTQARGLRESGGTTLSMGAVTDGDLLQRNNANVLGVPCPLDICEGRLSLTSGTAVTTGDVTSAGTLYFVPFRGSRVALYDGTRWKLYSFSERSLSLSVTSGKNYDVFLYDNAGTLTLELSAAWTNDTTRASALTTQDGVLVKSGATTRRYLGTIRASASNACEDSDAKRYCWNYYNRVQRKLKAVDTTNTWTYSTETWRQANGSTSNRVEYVVGGLAEEQPVNALVLGLASNTTGGINAAVGIGVDSTTVNSATLTGSHALSDPTSKHAFYRGYPGIGYHALNWLEISQNTGTTAWYGDNNKSYIQSGLMAEVWG